MTLLVSGLITDTVLATIVPLMMELPVLTT
ncbi:Uncharacterised protein [Mycobacterium tuberculosis]|nr:Uncharacterised protein [Mycobacterium tuberculosis]